MDPMQAKPFRKWLAKLKQSGFVYFAALGSKVLVCRAAGEVTWRGQTHLHAGQLCIGDALALGRQLCLSKVLQAGTPG